MKKMTILVDMDDTLENLCDIWIQCINERNGTNVHIDDIKEWNMPKHFPGIESKDVFEPLFDKEMWKRVKPLPGAVKYLKKIIDDGHKVVVVTASHQDTVSYKLNYVLFKYFPYLSTNDVIVTSQKQLIRGDILIDDAPHNLEGGSYIGVLMSAPHNRDYDADKNGFFRADNWKQIYKIVCDITGKE